MSCKVPTINPQPDPTSQRRDTCGGFRIAPRLGEVGRDDLRRERIRERSVQPRPRVSSLAVYNMRDAWVEDPGRSIYPILCGVSLHPCSRRPHQNVHTFWYFPLNSCFLTTVTYYHSPTYFHDEKTRFSKRALSPAAFLIQCPRQFHKEQGLEIS